MPEIQLGSGLSTTALGGWYDTVDANENGDKCAWVGEPLNAILGLPTLPGQPTVTPIPGAIGDIKGNQGTTFAVQSLWSNESAARPRLLRRRGHGSPHGLGQGYSQGAVRVAASRDAAARRYLRSGRRRLRSAAAL